MIEGKATIKNEQGIHCRPSSAIIKACRQMQGKLRVISSSGTCDLRSIMGLLSLGLAKGMEITVQVEGEQEEVNCRELIELFETEFDFPQ